MPPVSSVAYPDAQRDHRNATRAVFFIAGLGVAAWAPLVPFAKRRLGIDDGDLGLLLLCMGAGSMVALPVTGSLVGRFGCRPVIASAAILACLTLPLLATLSDPPMLAAALAVFGGAIGSLDAAMNIQAIIVERESGRRMMSGFHGLYSMGGIAGATVMTLLLSAGASPLAAILCVVAVIAAALAAAMPNLLTQRSRQKGSVFALPSGGVLVIGVLCFVMFLTEGAVLDWSGVFLTSVRGMDAVYAGLGYAAFALAMTTGRFTGDHLVHRFGGRMIIVCGGFCAAAGFAFATLVPAWPAAVAGYAFVGAGCANIVPVLFTSAGRQGTPENIAVPAITTLGYAGILTGPAAVGFVAHATSLSVAFLVLAALLVGVAASGRVVRT